MPSEPIGTSQAEIQLKKDLQRQHMLDRVFESEEKSQLKREYREQARIERERQLQESLARAELEKIQKKQAIEQEERLAIELERYKLEQTRDAKMRQQLRATRLLFFLLYKHI